MAERATKGTWVEIHTIILQVGERAPQVPDDTQNVPLEMRAKGFLTHDAIIGETCEITTQAGRRLSGELAAINPAYDHGFGAPVPELSTIGAEVRALLVKRRDGP
ncbi:2-amino-4-oxopentanoate thiolase subunit OrtA [Pseudomonadota bacterium]